MKNEAQSKRLDYRTRRSNMMYYRYIDFLVRALAADAESMIDVGSSNTRLLESFDWIPKRDTLDVSRTYTSKSVTGIKQDFFDFEPEGKYDFATCLQVLEHIPEAKSFARKLFQTADRVLISVPYLWEPPGRGHIHDPVDLNKLLDWTGREPSYHLVVREPLHNAPHGDRLICYYHLENERFDLLKVRRNVITVPHPGDPPAERPAEKNSQKKPRPQPVKAREHPISLRREKELERAETDLKLIITRMSTSRLAPIFRLKEEFRTLERKYAE